MNVESKKPIKIFAKDRPYNGTTFRVYSTGISSRGQDGTYNYVYIPVKFREGIIVEDRQLINLLSAWLMPFKIKESFTIGLFVNDFNLVDKKDSTNKANNAASSGYYNMDDLPF